MSARPPHHPDARPVLAAPLAVLAVLAVILVSSASVPSPARAADAPHHPVSLQLLHPLGTSPDPATTTDARLSLLWARSGTVHWLDAGLIATTTGGDVRGVQGVGLYAGVDRDLRGLGFTGGVHRVGGDV